jgi:hypothetical protein
MVHSPRRQSWGSSVLGNKWKICSSLSTNLKLLSQIQGNLINNRDYVLVYNFCWGGRCEYCTGLERKKQQKAKKKSYTYIRSLVYLLAMFTLILFCIFCWRLFFQWRFDPIPGHDLPVRDFGITLIGPTTLSRSPLDERSAWRRDHALKTHNTQRRQTSVLPAGFETTVPASFRPQTYTLERAVTGIGFSLEIRRDS